MASDSVSITEDAEMAECDGDKVVTMMDVLQEQQDFEEDANAVLGASDDKNCTYSKGYIKRQALYACLTCCIEAKTDPTKRAGVCLACSLNCHENHELVELYTKRNFRCDCGNPKFNSHPCQFTPDKTDLNDENIYNQNFSGLYCTCQRPYPDPEATFEDDMIQCIICEDWLHASHLEAAVPANDQYSEMICKSCMEKNEFLHDYGEFAVNAETSDVDIVTVNGSAKSSETSLCNGDLEKENLLNGTKENITEATNIKVNGDVEMGDNNEKGEDEAIANTESDKFDGSVPLKTDDGIKQQLTSVSTESEIRDSTNTDNIDENKMELDIESKNENVAETNEQVNNDACDNVGSNIDNKENITESSIAAASRPSNDTINDNQTESTEKVNENIDSTEKESENSDQTLQEQTETKTQEQIVEQSTNQERGDGDHVTDSSEKTEQQLLDDLSALTADNPQLEENKEVVTEGKPVESLDKKTEDNTDINNEDKLTETKETADSLDIAVSKTENDNIQVPDTSQSDQLEKENIDNKSDPVMDAIDELLETANDANEANASEKNKECASESTENIETKESNDVEMSTIENKGANVISDKTEEISDIGVKISTVEMSDITSQSQSPESENKSGSEIAADAKSNDVKESEANNIETSIEESKVDNEAVKEITDDPEVTDRIIENITQENESENELGKTADENDSTNKTQTCTDENIAPNVTENPSEHKRKLSSDLREDISFKKAKLDCVRPKGVNRVFKGATFWPSNFRQKLCTCGECISMYKDLKVLFLTDPEDTVSAYENLGKENAAGGASQYEKGLQALSSLDRIQQINALTEYNKMRDKLLDFLKSFKDRKEIVKEEDIKAFFAGMKPRREPDGVYFCR